MFEILKKIIKLNNKTETPEGLCPNCWGKQEYGGKFYEAIKNKNVNINNFEENKGWINDYAERNLNHIQLIKNNNESICQTCKLTYKG